MAKDAQHKADGEEPKVWITDEIRKELRAQRDKIGMSQRTLAARIGVVSATISNVETGTQKTLSRRDYAKWRKVLFRDTADIPDDLFEQLVNEIIDADLDETRKLIAIAKTIKKPKKQE